MRTTLLALAIVTSSPTAYAGTLSDQPLIELLGVDEARADGRSEHHVYLLTLDEDGRPLPQARLKSRASIGQLSEPVEVAPGLYRLRYTPPTATRATRDLLSVDVQLNRSVRTVERSIALVPAAASTIQVNTRSSSTGARFTAQAVNSKGELVEGAHLVARAASGRLESVQLDESGELTGRWTDVHGAAHGLITVLDQNDPSGIWGASIVPSPGAPASVALFPLPERIPADPGAWIPIRAIAVDREGRPDPRATVSFHASAGTFSTPESSDDGVYTAWLAPASSPSEGSLKISVSLGTGPVSDSITVPLVPSRAHHVSLSTEPADVEDGMGAIQTRVRALASDRTELVGRDVRFLGAGLIPGQVVETGLGNYEGYLGIPEHGPVDLAAAVAAPNTGLPLRHLLLLPDRDQTAGAPLVGLTILTLDALGYPVPGQPVTLSVLQGGGTVQLRAITDDTGLARAEYEPTSVGSLAIVQATAKGHVATANLLQDADRLPLAALPPSGAREHVELATGWRRALPTLSLRSAPPPLPKGSPTHGRANLNELPARAQEAAPEAGGSDVQLSLGGAVSSYAMLQEPSSISPLLGSSFQVGGVDFPNATPIGGFAGLRAWVGTGQALGLRARVDVQQWSLTAAAFGGQVHSDALLNAELQALARASFHSGSTRYHLGARVGPHYDDALLILGTTAQPEFRAFHMPGLSIGAELGVAGPKLQFVGGLNETLVNASYPYRTAIDATLGAQLAPRVSVELGVDRIIRSVPVVDGPAQVIIGHLSDQRSTAHLGLAFQLGAP